MWNWELYTETNWQKYVGERFLLMAYSNTLIDIINQSKSDTWHPDMGIRVTLAVWSRMGQTNTMLPFIYDWLKSAGRTGRCWFHEETFPIIDRLFV